MKTTTFSQQTATIHMTVNDDSAFLSPYAETGRPVIATEVADFLENSANAYRPGEKLHLQIKSTCIDDEEKPRYTQAIANYFSLELEETNRNLKRKTVVSVIFTLIGILALAFMFVCGKRELNDLWIECIDIFAWVFLWEAVDQFFIERSPLLMRRKRLKNFTEMKITYC